MLNQRSLHNHRMSRPGTNDKLYKVSINRNFIQNSFFDDTSINN